MTRFQKRRRAQLRVLHRMLAQSAPLLNAPRIERKRRTPSNNYGVTSFAIEPRMVTGAATGHWTRPRDMQHQHYVVLSGQTLSVPIRADKQTECYRWQRCLAMREPRR